jgi:hypothetical protein
MWTQLPKWEIATEDGKAGFTERTRERDEELRLAVRPSAVSKDKTIAGEACRNVQEAANGRGSGSVGKFILGISVAGHSL